MTIHDIYAISPLITVAASALAVMISIAVRRSHIAAAAISFAGITLAFCLLFAVAPVSPRQVTPLLIIDSYAIFFMGLILAATLVVLSLSFRYLSGREDDREEYYILMLVAATGAMTLAGSTHFASFFLGLEILSIPLYALIAYVRKSDRGVEGGIKYLVLAAVSASFLLMGMALVYAVSGNMEFGGIASYISSRPGPDKAGSLLLLTGIAMIVAGTGFKLAVVPFHLWTPDVYEGAPAPVTAFIATVSKGAVFALLLRFSVMTDLQSNRPLFIVFSFIAVSSMFAGNLLALYQANIKRLLAYSSIAHLGYLLVPFLAGGKMAVTAAGYYLVVYFVSTLGAFGIITLLSGKTKEADLLEDYRGLALRRPWPAGVFTGVLLSLAGIPLTAGFVGKFYAIAAGMGSSLWPLVASLVINSAIGLFYYLRVISVMYSLPLKDGVPVHPAARRLSSGIPLSGGIVLALLTLLLVWLGVHPSPLIGLLEALGPGV